MPHPAAIVLRLGNHRYPYVCAAIARSLGRLGVRVHLAHTGRRRADSRSRWLAGSHRLSPGEGLMDGLLSVGRTVEREGAPILIPVDDPGAFFVDEHADQLEGVFTFPHQPTGLVAQLSNKAKLHALCAELGIPTPAVLEPASEQELQQLAESLEYPVMIKIADGRLRRTSSVAVAGSRAELLAQASDMQAAPEAPNLILQEYVPGGASDVWMFNGYFNAQSDMLFGITGRKLRQYPVSGGVTAFGITEPNERIRELTVRLVRECKYRGPIDIGFRYDRRDEDYKLLDVNPRVGATFRLFVDSLGADVVRVAYGDLALRPESTGSPLYGRTWMVENYDLRSSIEGSRDVGRGVRRWLRALGRVDEGAWFATDDVAPFFAMLWQSAEDGVALIPRPAFRRASGG